VGHVMRIFIASTLIWGSATLAHAAELELPNSKTIVRGEPCRMEATATEGGKRAAPLRVSRRSAIYIIQHIHMACRILAGTRDDGSRSDAIRGDLHDSIIRPIYRAHPDVAAALPRSSSPPKVFHATPRDIGRATASRIDDEITRLRNNIFKLGSAAADRSADKSAAMKALEPSIDAAAELSFAGKIVFDAYPDLFAKAPAAVPDQSRTAERDANFRKAAPPLGSVRLSDAALTLIQSFMRDVHRVDGGDHIAAITWAREQKSRRPGDKEWSNDGAGWTLGAYRKTEVPPDVIDTVRGVEIMFTAEDPSALAGKTFDATKQKFFVRD
jgi:hypothetical protein